MRTGDRTVYKVAQKWEECPGRRSPRWRAEMYTRAGSRRPESVPRFFARDWDVFSVQSLNRKAHPVLSAGSGTQFPPQKESMSHSDAGFRSTLSQTGSKRKAYPALKPNSGMQFPQELSVKEKDPFAEVLVNSRWRGRESRPRSARADRCGASAPCELRWQTLTRLLSSAPSRGSIPCGGHIKEKDPFAEVLVNSRWRGRESNP